MLCQQLNCYRYSHATYDKQGHITARKGYYEPDCCWRGIADTIIGIIELGRSQK